MGCRTRLCKRKKRRRGTVRKVMGGRQSELSPMEPTREGDEPISFLSARAGRWVDLSGSFLGGHLFLCLNGRSMAAAAPALAAARGISVMAVNNGCHGLMGLGVRPNFWVSVDQPERFMAATWMDPTIMKFAPVTSIRGAAQVRGRPERVAALATNLFGFRKVERPAGPGIFAGPDVCWGGVKPTACKSVMVAALSIAKDLGFSRVYLAGCDFRMEVEGERRTGGYFFDEQRSAQAVSNNVTLFRRLEAFFAASSGAFSYRDMQVFNCTEGSALSAFPAMPLRDAIEAAGIPEDIFSEGTYGKYVGRRPPKPGGGEAGA